MFIKAALQNVIAHYQLLMPVDAKQEVITDFPSLKQAALDEDAKQTITTLSQLVDTIDGKAELSTIQQQFIQLAHSRYELVKDTALTVFAEPNSLANTCWNEFFIVLYGPVPWFTSTVQTVEVQAQLASIEQYQHWQALTHAQQIAVYLQTFISNPQVLTSKWVIREENSKFNLDNIKPVFSIQTLTTNETVIDQQMAAEIFAGTRCPSEIIIIENQLLPIAAVMYWSDEKEVGDSLSFRRLKHLRQLHAELARDYPNFYKKFSSYNSHTFQLSQLLMHCSLGEALIELQCLLRLSGTKITGQEYAPAVAEKAVIAFQNYLEAFGDEIKACGMMSSAKNPAATLQWVIVEHLIINRGCVELAAGYLSDILNNPANAEQLRKIPQVDEAGLLKAVARIFEVSLPATLYQGHDNNATLPMLYLNEVLDRVKINNINILVAFLRNFEASFYPELLKHAIIDVQILNNVDNLITILVHLDSSQLSAFCNRFEVFIAKNIENFCKIISLLSVEQRTLVLTACKNQLPLILLNAEKFNIVIKNQNYSLTVEQTKIVIDACRSDLPKIINDIAGLIKVFKNNSIEIRTFIFEICQSSFIETIKHAWAEDLNELLLLLDIEQSKIVAAISTQSCFAQCKTEVFSHFIFIIRNLDIEKSQLIFNLYAKYLVNCKVREYDFESMLKILDIEQIKLLIDVCSESIKASISSAKQLSDILDSSIDKCELMINAFQEKIINLINTKNDVERFLKHRSQSKIFMLLQACMSKMPLLLNSNIIRNQFFNSARLQTVMGDIKKYVRYVSRIYLFAYARDTNDGYLGDPKTFLSNDLYDASTDQQIVDICCQINNSCRLDDLRKIVFETLISGKESRTAYLQGLTSFDCRRPEIKIVLRALLTQAVLKSLADQKDDNYLDDIKLIVESCYAAGYNILVEKTMDSEINVNYENMSFLELAYHCQATDAVRFFYSLGHKPLSPKKLQRVRENKQIPILSELYSLTIYYQKDGTELLQNQLYEMMFDEKAKVANDFDDLTVLKIAWSMLCYGGKFNHGFFGGTKRIKEFYLKLWGENAGEQLEMPAKSPGAAYLQANASYAISEEYHWVLRFKNLFKGYALQNQRALATIEKYRALRQKANSLPPLLSKHLIASPVKDFETIFDYSEFDETETRQTYVTTRLKIHAIETIAVRLQSYECKDLEQVDIKRVNQEIINAPINKPSESKTSDQEVITIIESKSDNQQPTRPSIYQILNIHQKSNKRKSRGFVAAVEISYDSSSSKSPQTHCARTLLKWMPQPKSIANSMIDITPRVSNHRSSAG